MYVPVATTHSDVGSSRQRKTEDDAVAEREPGGRQRETEREREGE